jgi:YVTN family beta-propeller protein
MAGRRRSSVIPIAAVVAVLALGALTAGAVELRRIDVGPRPDGTAVLPTGWTVTPAGAQTQLGEKPFGAALSPDGRTLLVTDNGQWLQALQVVDVASGRVVQTLTYRAPEALFLGVAWSPDGRFAYASAGTNQKIRVYTVTGRTLTETAPIRYPSAAARNPFPGGLAVSPDGAALYIADHRGAALSVADTATRRIVATVPVGQNPYGVQLTPDGRTAYVSNWGGDTVTAVDTATRSVRRTIVVGHHPSAMTLNPVTGEVYVADSDADTVSVVDPRTNAVVRRIGLAPYPGAPVGASPNALAIAPDGRTLYVANAGDDDVAVVRLGAGHDTVAGLIPTGWYPTTVTVTRDGRRLLVTNAKGLGAGPNPHGPDPYTDSERRGTPEWQSQYVGSMILGTLSTLDVPGPGRLAAYTAQVHRNNRPTGSFAQAGAGLGQVVPRRGRSALIRHVIYVLKENRTYDQVLGDLGRGNGDPSLAVLGTPVTPNQHRLARQFVTLDNFYADGAVSGDGWQWSAGAYANTHNEKTWPSGYGDRYGGDGDDALQVDAPGRDEHASYLWDRVIAAHLTQRHYGWWTDGQVPNVHAKPTAPELNPYVDPRYPSWDLTQHDYRKVEEWQREYRQYEATRTLPAFEMVALINDHTNGLAGGTYTPRALVADNDYALGKLVDTVSHSRDWASTAIFVVEDDAQAGPDHVDAHRTIAQVISPYTRTGRVDSTLYSTVSMLRTIECILGLPPMTQFDAAATPMLGSFTTRPDLTPYDVVRPAQNMEERNPVGGPGARESERWDFGHPDSAPADALNRAIWQSVRGPDSVMPGPRDHGAPVR